MSIKQEILELPGWWEISRQINEANETSKEFEYRQVYIYEKLMERDLSDWEIDWKEFEQLPEDSYVDFAIRFVEEYSYILDRVDFIPDYYKVVFDFNKQPHIVLNSENPIFDRDGYQLFED
jgi:hypothetical protein